MKTYLFHGPSGCGKDTQVDLLMNLGNFEKIGTGDMFRSLHQSSENDADAKEAYEYITNGKFVPTELTYKLLTKWVEKYDNSKDWIFVSVVRTPDQIVLFDQLLEKFGRKLDSFVHFNLSEEAAIERMSLRKMCVKCGATYHTKYKPEKVAGVCDVDGGELVTRDDDKPESIKSRLQEYNKNIIPILEEYENRGVLINVDATPSIDEIHKKLVDLLKF